MTDPLHLQAVDSDGIVILTEQLEGHETLGSIILNLREHLAGREAVVHVGGSTLNVDAKGQVTARARTRPLPEG